jgi:hypothetical protein
MNEVEARIAEWRSAVARSRALSNPDVDELEAHLRDQMADLAAAGLDDDEAFLIAVKRLGRADRITAEFAREHGDRLWRHLLLPGAGDGPDGAPAGRRSLVTALGFAVLAAIVVQVARLVADVPDRPAPWFWRNLGLMVLPVLIGYFAVLRRIRPQQVLALLAPMVVLGVVTNLYPYPKGSDTAELVAMHLPVALWFVVGVAYLAGDARSPGRRMDAVRFTGEWLVYYALIALGGGVLMGLTIAVLTPIAPHADQEVLAWVAFSGAAGAAVVAAWLVEAKKGVIENLAPVLAAIFTPLFAAMLLVAVAGYLVAGVAGDFDRDLVTVFDVLLLVVLGLLLYGLSAREPRRPVGTMDVIRLIAVLAAVLLDALVLGSMLIRVGHLGATANRVAALGLNVLLMVDLLVTGYLALRRWRDHPDRVQRWQMALLPVFGVWAAVVVLALPPAFA